MVVGYAITGEGDALAVLFSNRNRGPSVNDLTHRDSHSYLLRLQHYTVKMPVARKGESRQTSLMVTMDFFSSGSREKAEPCRVCHSLGLGNPYSPSLPLQTQTSPCAYLAICSIDSKTQIDYLFPPINLRLPCRDLYPRRTANSQELATDTNDDDRSPPSLH